jgi:transaldolase
MNSIQTLRSHGQSIWLDLISRSLLTSGELKRLMDQGVTGVTSNPSIFQKSICETSDYANAINNVFKSQPDIEVTALYEKLAVQDIQMAADALRPVYDATGGTDGFVSLEVSPHLAAFTENTVSEAQRLWKLVGRPNLMIKVPATPQGLPAIETLISQGINVNATLIFSTTQYADVAYAYIHGLERNRNPQRVASVASFFISRIDTLVDKALENTHQTAALALRGKTAVASAKVVYQRFREIFYGAPFEKPRGRGGKVQKLVWGSTGTKNPAYSDVIYIEEIIGPDTINTLPMSTLTAFLDHGKARPSLRENLETARKVFSSLADFNIDMQAVTEKLLEDGVQAFIQAYDQLMDSLKGRCNV